MVLYCVSCWRAIWRNSLGGMPSRVRNPCMAWDAALRGCPVSQTSTRRRLRPRMSAALRPAGPAPTMTTSYMEALFLLRAEPCGAKGLLIGRERAAALFDENGFERGVFLQRQLRRLDGSAAVLERHVDGVARLARSNDLRDLLKRRHRLAVEIGDLIVLFESGVVGGRAGSLEVADASWVLLGW